MLTIQLITATDLHERSVRLSERGLFPDLIRRLILASDSSVRWLHFRAHEGIAIGGWDGSIEQANGAAPYIPAGSSRWELGTNQDALSKIKSDFEKRNATPEDDAAQIALIFAVIRRRSDKEEWAKDFTSRSPYREVHIIDADDLETWLQQHPSIHIWLSVMLGKHVEGALDLENWWLDWAHQTTPTMLPEWLLAGRTTTQIRIREWLKGTNDTLTVFASTTDEARALVAASILALPDEEKTAALTRTLVVTDERIWQQLIRSREKLILIPDFESDRFSQLRAAAIRQSHRVILCRPATEARPTDEVAPFLSREKLQQVLEQAGLPQLDASEKASLARRSFTAFHRTMLTDKSLQSLWWMEAPVAQQLLPLLLLNRWQANSPGDQQIIEHLTQQPYATVEQQLLAWVQQPDAPVRRIADEWFVLDPADVWEQTAPYLTKDLLTRFSESVQHILTLPLARFNLPPDERRWAPIRGVYDDYSTTLRMGITITLAVLNTRDQPAGVGVQIPAWVDNQIRDLLETALADPSGHLIASLDYHLPALAEAAPDAFLAVILSELQRPDSVLLRLFDEEESLIHRTAHHTGLLWALEGLAWPAQFLSDAALALAGLDRLDPGGQLSNRPINSLRTIFLGWHPQTNASVSERLAVLDRIRKVYPEVGWRLVQRLLPKHHDHGYNSHMPTFHWRAWQLNPDKKVPMVEYFQFIAGLTERLLSDVGTDPQRWAQLIDELPKLLELLNEDALRVRVLAQLQQLASLPIPDADRLNLLKELREFLNHHRSCQDTYWAWGEEQLCPIDTLYHQLQPESMLLRHAWLFDQWPRLPEGLEHRRHEENSLLIQQRQEEAFGELVAAEGQNVVEQLLPHVPNHFELGQVIARSRHVSDSDRIRLFQQFAATADENQGRLAQGLAARFTRILGNEQAAAVVRKQAPNWKPEQQAIWLWALPMNFSTWQLAHELGEEVSVRYWQIANVYVEHDAEAPKAIQQFLVHKRPAAAAKALYMLQHNVNQRLPIDLVIETLKSLLCAQADETSRVHDYELETLLDELVYITDAHRPQAIKLAFRFGRATTLSNPKLLNLELQRNPAFFVELLAALYLPDNYSPADSENLTEEEKQYKIMLGQQAWSILHNWHTLPGLQADGSLDERHFEEWVNDARKLATENGIRKGFDIQLGLLISHAPAGSDGVWPHPAVCVLLEAEAQNETIARHVHMGCYNRHGRTHIVNGGRREQAIASEYSNWAEKIQTKYPATARLLRQLQEDFTRQSHNEQVRTEREEQFGL